jgi:Ring finger domain
MTDIDISQINLIPRNLRTEQRFGRIQIQRQPVEGRRRDNIYFRITGSSEEEINLLYQINLLHHFDRLNREHRSPSTDRRRVLIIEDEYLNRSFMQATQITAGLWRSVKPNTTLTLDTKQVERCLQTALSTTQPIPTCPITMEALTDWSQIMVTSCNHLFEKYALVTWLDKNKGCPMCRTPCVSVGLRRYPLYKQIYCQNDNRVGWAPFINPLTALCLVSRRGPGGGGGGGGGRL